MIGTVHLAGPVRISASAGDDIKKVTGEEGDRYEVSVSSYFQAFEPIGVGIIILWDM